jgi:hypothetical protein
MIRTNVPMIGLLAVGHFDDCHVAQADVAGADFQNVADDGRRPRVAQQIPQSRQHALISFRQLQFLRR